MKRVLKELRPFIILWVIMIILFIIWCITGKSYSELIRGIFV